MLVDSAKKSWRTLATAIAYPDYHTNWWEAGRDEFSTGQWRQPYALHGASNAIWLEARGGTLFVGTRLGLFALAGSSGQLLWHTLPDIDLSFVAPALPSV